MRVEIEKHITVNNMLSAAEPGFVRNKLLLTNPPSFMIKLLESWTGVTGLNSLCICCFSVYIVHKT